VRTSIGQEAASRGAEGGARARASTGWTFPGLKPQSLFLLWLTLGGLAAGAYFGLPIYMESLDARIVFRQPDCIDVAREQARSTTVDVAVRGDSLEAWMKSCLSERQKKMAHHADWVGFGVMSVLVTFFLLLTALVIHMAWMRLGPPRGRAG